MRVSERDNETKGVLEEGCAVLASGDEALPLLPPRGHLRAQLGVAEHAPDPQQQHVLILGHEERREQREDRLE
jgi:hypothetical protein